MHPPYKKYFESRIAGIMIASMIAQTHVAALPPSNDGVHGSRSCGEMSPGMSTSTFSDDNDDTLAVSVSDGSCAADVFASGFTSISATNCERACGVFWR